MLKDSQYEELFVTGGCRRMTISLENMDQEEAWGVMMILPPGRHICEITEVEEQTSSNGNPMIVITSEATEGPYAASSIKDWVVITDATRGKVKQILEAAEVDVPSGPWEFDSTELVGRRVAVYVQSEPKYDDPSKMVKKVKGYEAPRESDDPSKMVRRVKGYEAPRESEIPPDREGLKNGGATGADDDIPF